MFRVKALPLYKRYEVQEAASKKVEHPPLHSPAPFGHPPIVRGKSVKMGKFSPPLTELS